MAGILAFFITLAALVVSPTQAAAQPNRETLCSPVTGLSLQTPHTADLLVPVIVHYMKKTSSSNDIATKITPAMLQTYFGDAGRVTLIWRQAGLRPYLQRVETCAFAFSDFAIPTNPGEEIPNPDGSAAGKALFWQINQTYNFRASKGLDLYVWWAINTVGGYGDRSLGPDPATSRRRDGSTWIDQDCLPIQDCDLLLAHEIGHFLGLCHACTISDPIPNIQCTRCLPRSMRQPDQRSFVLANCASVDGPRIMRSDNLRVLPEPKPHMVSGSELSDCERRCARATWQSSTPGSACAAENDPR